MSKNSDGPRIPLELLQQRRESQPPQSPLAPGHMQGRSAQVDAHAAQNQYSQPAPPGVNSNEPLDGNSATIPSQQPRSIPSGNTAAPHIVNDIAAQKQLMREKRELAIRRKKDEEEREEAEKRERIRIRMEKMGLPPLVEKKESEKVTTRDVPNEAKRNEEKKVEPENAKPNDGATQPPEMKSQEASKTAPRSPPKPPVPDSSGTPKQYGLMKVHAPTTGLHLSKGRPLETRPRTVAPVEQPAPIEQNRRIEQNTLIGQSMPVEQSVPIVQERISAPELDESKVIPPTVNGEVNGKRDYSISASPDNRNDNRRDNGNDARSETRNGARHDSRNDNRNQDLFKGSRPQQPWKSIQNDTDAFSGWNGTGMTTHSSPGGNLWGPPASFKSLGNGTFDRSVQRPQLHYQENYLPPQQPQPIGPPKHLQRPREPTESNQAIDHSSIAIAEDFQTIPTFPSSDVPSPHLTTHSDDPHQTSKMEKPGSPPQSTLPAQVKPAMNTERFPHGQEQTRATLAAWGNFHITSAKEDQEKKRQAAHDEAARLAEEERTGIRRHLELPSMSETWRQVKVDDHGGNRQVVSVAKHTTAPSSQQLNGELPNAAFPNPAHLVVPSGTGRGSRFFPSIGQNAPAQSPRAVSYVTTFNCPSSPPPPESENHPAYFRDQQRPLVNLPFSRPKPTVRLPPPVAAPVHAPVIPVVQAVPLRAVPQPLVNNPSWQDRFNGLLGLKKPQAEKKVAHVTDFSATKVPLDVPIAKISAAVTLPPKEEATVNVEYDEGVTSKATEDEEALFENREFGSLPTVLIPAKAPEFVQQPFKAGKNGKNQNSRVGRHKEVDAETVKNLEDKANEVPNGIVIFVKMIGMEEKRSKTMPRMKANNFNQFTQRNRHVSSGSKAGKGFKPREGPSNFNQKIAPPTSVPRIPMPNGVVSQPRTQFSKHNPHWNPNPRVANAVQ